MPACQRLSTVFFPIECRSQYRRQWSSRKSLVGLCLAVYTSRGSRVSNATSHPSGEGQIAFHVSSQSRHRRDRQSSHMNLRVGAEFQREVPTEEKRDHMERRVTLGRALKGRRQAGKTSNEKRIAKAKLSARSSEVRRRPLPDPRGQRREGLEFYELAQLEVKASFFFRLRGDPRFQVTIRNNEMAGSSDLREIHA